MRIATTLHADGSATVLSIDKSKLTETDIITKFIPPAVKDAGWNDMTQIRQEVKLRDGKEWCAVRWLLARR